MSEETVLEATGLRKHYSPRKGLWGTVLLKRRLLVRAVDGVDFRVSQRSISGLAGESGCGKTTTGRLLTLLEAPSAGRICLRKEDITTLDAKRLKEIRRSIQMIFQDPYESLNPRYKVSNAIEEPLQVHQIGSREGRHDAVCQILERVGLEPPEQFLERYPHELSGGQRQRIVIARAMILKPCFVVADEPVSMLDTSIRAGIMNLMLDLKNDLNVALLVITHDLAVARYMCDRMSIMYAGKIVESGETEELINHPEHPYTKILLSAVPIPDGKKTRARVRTQGEAYSAQIVESGCKFHPRCLIAKDICRTTEPMLDPVRDDHTVACHNID